MAERRIEAVVRGRVQGVAFRHYTQVEAARLGLRGWVANRGDGSVRVVAEGGEPALRHLADWLHMGPPAAHVDDVDIRWSDAASEFRSFEIRY